MTRKEELGLGRIEMGDIGGCALAAAICDLKIWSEFDCIGRESDVAVGCIGSRVRRPSFAKATADRLPRLWRTASALPTVGGSLVEVVGIEPTSSKK